MATITYEITGSFPPFAAELVANGIVIGKQSHEKEGTYSFRNVTASGEISVIVYDTATGTKTASQNITTTTTTTTTTTAAPTTTTTTTAAPTTTTTTTAPTTTADPCLAFQIDSFLYSESSRTIVATIVGSGGENYSYGVFHRKQLLPSIPPIDTAVASPPLTILSSDRSITTDLTDEPDGTYVAKITGATGAITECVMEKTVSVTTTTTTAAPRNGVDALYEHVGTVTLNSAWSIKYDSPVTESFVRKTTVARTSELHTSMDVSGSQSFTVERIDAFASGLPAAIEADTIIFITHIRDGNPLTVKDSGTNFLGQFVSYTASFSGVVNGDDFYISIQEVGTEGSGGLIPR